MAPRLHRHVNSLIPPTHCCWPGCPKAVSLVVKIHTPTHMNKCMHAHAHTCTHQHGVPASFSLPCSWPILSCIPGLHRSGFHQLPSGARPLGHSLPTSVSPLRSPPHLRRATVFANGSLQLTQVRPRNAGVYRCIGQGQRGPPVILEATLHLAGESEGLGCRGRGCLQCCCPCRGLASCFLLRAAWRAEGGRRCLGSEEEVLGVPGMARAGSREAGYGEHQVSWIPW